MITMDSWDIARPARSKTPPTVYTPSVTRSHEIKPVTYKLNAKKHLIRTEDKQDHSCNMEFKEGTLVTTCNAGNYEIRKSSI